MQVRKTSKCKGEISSLLYKGIKFSIKFIKICHIYIYTSCFMNSEGKKIIVLCLTVMKIQNMPGFNSWCFLIKQLHLSVTLQLSSTFWQTVRQAPTWGYNVFTASLIVSSYWTYFHASINVQLKISLSQQPSGGF